MKNLILTLAIVICLCGMANAQEASTTEGKPGKGIIIHLYPKTFATLAEAQAVANKLDNGDVLRDQDTKQYQVIYGNVKINDVFVLTSMEEK